MGDEAPRRSRRISKIKKKAASKSKAPKRTRSRSKTRKEMTKSKKAKGKTINKARKASKTRRRTRSKSVTRRKETEPSSSSMTVVSSSAPVSNAPTISTSVPGAENLDNANMMPFDTMQVWGVALPQDDNTHTTTSFPWTTHRVFGSSSTETRFAEVNDDPSPPNTNLASVEPEPEPDQFGIFDETQD